jgi:hypothetical protein
MHIRSNLREERIEQSLAVDGVAPEPLYRHRTQREDLDVGEPGSFRFLEPHGLRDRPGDSAAPEAWVVPDASRKVTSQEHIGHDHPARGPQDPPGFGKDAVLVSGQVEDPVADDHIDGAIRQGNGRHVPLQKACVRQTGCLGIGLSQQNHLVRHIQADGSTAWPDGSRRQERINSSSAAQIEDGFVSVKVCGTDRMIQTEG